MPLAPTVVTDRSRRRVVTVLLASAVIMVAYWTLWFGARTVVASNGREAYVEFENAFPLADAWITGCLLGAAWTLHRRRSTALLWLLAGGGGGIYLFGMDVGVGLLRWARRRRGALLAGPTITG